MTGKDPSVNSTAEYDSMRRLNAGKIKSNKSGESMSFIMKNMSSPWLIPIHRSWNMTLQATSSLSRIHMRALSRTWSPYTFTMLPRSSGAPACRWQRPHMSTCTWSASWKAWDTVCSVSRVRRHITAKYGMDHINCTEVDHGWAEVAWAYLCMSDPFDPLDQSSCSCPLPSSTHRSAKHMGRWLTPMGPVR